MCGKNIIFAKNWAWKCSLFYYTWMGNSGSSSFFFLIFRENRIYLHHHEKNSNHVIAHGGVSYLLLWINVLRLHAYFYVNRFEHTCFLLIVYWARFPVKGGALFLSFITILTLYIFVPKQTQDEETDQTSALDGGVQADERPYSGREK